MFKTVVHEVRHLLESHVWELLELRRSPASWAWCSASLEAMDYVLEGLDRKGFKRKRLRNMLLDLGRALVHKCRDI